jgi:pyruvate dehydrogenase E2 component (dihydrolipoamide acetyltransferase)
MPHEIRMPSLGQTTDELRITNWLKAEGDPVRLGEPLLEVETDKATLEIESFATGILLKILRPVGDMVEAGTVVAYVGAQGEAPPAPGGNGHTPPPPLSLPREPDPTAATEDATPSGDKVLASPVARQLAKMHGVDLGRVRGSGPRGRIEKADVQALVDSAASQEAGVSTGPVADRQVPRHRLVIAQRLTQSIQTIPHITLTIAVDMSHARASLLTARAEGLTRLTYTHLVLRALAHALRVHPAINRHWIGQDKGPTYRQLDAANVGLAVTGDDTLLTVTIAEPDAHSLEDLVRHVATAVERGRSGMLRAGDIEPAAITLSNLGMHGVDAFQAIIDPGQTAIMAIGRVADRVVAIDGAMRVLPQMQMNLSVDHRVADGVLAAKFLRTVVDHLEAGGP